MRRDYVIAILLALAAIPIAIAAVVAPSYFPNMAPWAVDFAFLGGCGAALILLLLAALVAIRHREIAVAWASGTATPAELRFQRNRRELEAIQNEAAFQSGFDPSSAAAKEAALLVLAHLRASGVKIRNELPPFLPSADLNSWVNAVTEWMHDVIASLKAISVPDSVWFGTLDTVPESRVPIPAIRLGGKEDRELYVATFRQHDCRLARLDGLLNKYGVGTDANQAVLSSTPPPLSPPAPKQIPLREAMISLLKEVEAQESIWMFFIDKHSAEPEDKLVNLARLYTQRKPLIGDRRPTGQEEQISAFSVRMGEFFNHGSQLRHANNAWDNLRVRAADLDEEKIEMCRTTMNDKI